MTPEIQTVAIIGNEGDWGRRTDSLYQDAGYENRVGSDIKNPDSLLAKDAINAADIVHFSLPPAEIPLVIQAAGIQAFTGKRVIDNAGEKDQLIPMYTTLDRVGTSICSTHPNCIPTQPLENQTIMFMAVGNHSASATEIALAIHQKAGMIPVHLEINVHDAYMDVIQDATHLVNRSLVEATVELIQKYNLDPATLEKISTANRKLLDLATWRTAVQNPAISAQIVRQKLDNPRRAEITETLTRIITEISQTENQGELAARFRKTLDDLDPTGERRKRKLAETTAILEEMANLAAESVTVMIPVDRAGALIEVLQPFADTDISIGAIRSHKTNGAVEFRLGIKGIHTDPQILENLSVALSATGARLVTES